MQYRSQRTILPADDDAAAGRSTPISRGHWEGETLVVDVADNSPDTWFDASGNFHSEALHIVERYTRTSPDTISYEAAIEDPKTFTKPWKISFPLYRHQEKNLELLEYDCYAFESSK